MVILGLDCQLRGLARAVLSADNNENLDIIATSFIPFDMEISTGYERVYLQAFEQTLLSCITYFPTIIALEIPTASRSRSSYIINAFYGACAVGAAQYEAINSSSLVMSLVVPTWKSKSGLNLAWKESGNKGVIPKNAIPRLISQIYGAADGLSADEYDAIAIAAAAYRLNNERIKEQL